MPAKTAKKTRSCRTANHDYASTLKNHDYASTLKKFKKATRLSADKCKGVKEALKEGVLEIAQLSTVVNRMIEDVEAQQQTFSNQTRSKVLAAFRKQINHSGSTGFEDCDVHFPCKKCRGFLWCNAQ